MKYFYSFCLILVAIQANSQFSVTKYFDITPPQYDLGTKILPDGDGYAIFGYQLPLGSSSGGDLFLLRLDKDGNELSRHVYGLLNKKEGMGKGVVPVGNNGWLIAGWQLLSGSGAPKGFLVRVGSNGNVLWSNTLTIPNIAQVMIYDLVALPTGGFIAVGGASSVTAVIKLSDDGDVIWSKKFNYGPANSVCINATGGNCFVLSRNKVLKIRTTDGLLKWTADIELPQFGNPDGFMSVDLSDIVSIGDGSFAITGTALNDEIFDFTLAPYASLWKETGEILWTEAYPADPNTGEGGGSGKSILYLPNQQEFLLSSEGNDGINITRVDRKGNLLAVHKIPTPGLCVFPVLNKHQGKYFATGGIFFGGMNTLFFRSAGNWFPDESLKMDNRSHLPTKQTGTISPNPTSDMLNLKFSSQYECLIKIKVINAVGKVVMESQNQVSLGENLIALNVNSLPSGVYWISAPEIEFPTKIWVKK